MGNMVQQRKEMRAKAELSKRLPARFPGITRLPKGWRNGVMGWPTQKPATPGLFSLDIEHVPEAVVGIHNDTGKPGSIGSLYRKNICVHNCPFCFSVENTVYGKTRREGLRKVLNRVLTLEQTMDIVDQAREIAKEEGHRFESVKFLGPGELLMNPDLFKIIEEYKKRGVILGIFTKGALLGDDELANRYQGMRSAELVERLARCRNVCLHLSFQGFDAGLQDSLVVDPTDKVAGITGYTKMRNKAVENLMASGFYWENGATQRLCIMNAPIVPENIDISFEIYRFFIERGAPVLMTPTMVSGKGACQMQKQGSVLLEWQEKLIRLYAKVYAYNLRKGIQTLAQVVREGISSYAGAEPCIQASTGMYIRANGLAQMCPGRFDKETVFGNLSEAPLSEIWEKSQNRKMGIEASQSLMNNRCPAKDAKAPEENGERAFPFGFYDEVMKRVMAKGETDVRNI